MAKAEKCSPAIVLASRSWPRMSRRKRAGQALPRSKIQPRYLLIVGLPNTFWLQEYLGDPSEANQGGLGEYQRELRLCRR